MYSTVSPHGNNAFSHLDDQGRVKIVDVSSKQSTERTATASATVTLGKELVSLIRKGNIKKGDVITTAKLAGIMGAKKTSSLIPLCHQINLTNVTVDIVLEEEHAVITCLVKTKDRTGVEMEALTGASIASLTLYDMVKSVKKDVTIADVRLVSKTGGKSDYSS